MKALAFLVFFLLSSGVHADRKKDTSKGLLPEVQLNSKNEEENDAKAMTSEILITNTENKAIESLQAILKKKKNSPDEADLWYRLGELYIRRAKSGRFFDLQISGKSKQLTLFPVPDEKGADWIKKAITIFNKIEKDFQKYPGMDTVLFNNAMAHQQIGKLKESQNLYEKLANKYPQSPLIPDTLVALGELYYDQRKFSLAQEYLARLEKFPEARALPYGLYKLAWTHYNMSDTKSGVRRLMQVLELSPRAQDGEMNRNKQYLRREALRDLTIFIGDTSAASELVRIFSKIAENEEFGQAMMDLAKLYESHSRFKDLNVFLGEFIEKHPENIFVAKAHLVLVEANESLKLRDQVVQHLNHVRDLCHPNSSWRLKHHKEIPDETCQQDYISTVKNIAEKWWDIWLKNKKHAEFTTLTEKVLKIIIDIENKEKPDLKTHYAYAELLFQLERFDEASEQYKLVSDKITDEPSIKHDATYAALFSKEKSLEKAGKEKSALKEGQRKDLAINYIEKYPRGAQIADVTFKLAVIYYDETNYKDAEKWLTPALSGQSGLELQAKAEDLQLDIYNLRKDYPGIQKLSRKILGDSKDSSRQAQMKKLLHEASYAEIQDQIKNGDPLQGAKKLVQYSTEHSTSPQASEALWQAMGIYFSQTARLEGAEAALIFARKNPTDKRTLEALKEAAKTFAEMGYLIKSADTLKQIAEMDKKEKDIHLETAADFYSLEKKYKEARVLYQGLVEKSDSKGKSRLYSKIMDTHADKESPEYKKVQGSLVSMNIEPFASQILYNQLLQSQKNKKNGETFELARKLMARDGDSVLRARARLIQAQILEEELFRQSMKSTQADRLGMVLTLKTEKLDKAQTAFLGASKMNPDAQIQWEAFSGIDRCYSHYVASLKALELPAGLSDEDQKTLTNEIQKIVQQIEEKIKDNSVQLKKLAKAQMHEKTQKWNLEEANQTLPPVARYPTSQFLKAYWPASSEMIFSKLKRLENKTSTPCLYQDAKNFSFHEAMATCQATKNIPEMEKIAQKLVGHKDHQKIGLYYLSLVSEIQGLHEKSLWLSEMGLKSQNDSPLFAYQKARMIYHLEGLTAALPFFDKVLATQMTSTETETLLGIKAFNEGDFETVSAKFSGFAADQLYNLEIGTLLSESLAQKGQVDRALKVIDQMLAKGPEVIELLLQKARVLESFKQARLPALETYERALKLATEDELKNWLDKKVKLIKHLTEKPAGKDGRAARNIGRPGYEEKI